MKDSLKKNLKPAFAVGDHVSTSSHANISVTQFCLKKSMAFLYTVLQNTENARAVGEFRGLVLVVFIFAMHFLLL